MRGLRNNCAAISLLVSPPATSRMICSSCGSAARRLIDLVCARFHRWPAARPRPVRPRHRAHPAAFWQLRPGHLRVRGKLCGATRPAGAVRRAGRRWIRQFATLMRIACSGRHQSAPDATVSAHPGVSNETPNAPLETCTRAHRTLRSARQPRSDLTERPGAPKARALAKLRYSPWCNYSSASAPLFRPPVPIPARVNVGEVSSREARAGGWRGRW